MTDTATEPIPQHWTTEGLDAIGDPPATASEANECLAHRDVAEIPSTLVPYLAAAAAELALLADIPWRFSADDPPVALLRIIAKATLRRPDAGGPHTARLLDQLK